MPPKLAATDFDAIIKVMACLEPLRNFKGKTA